MQRLPALDGLRGFAALAVVFFHALLGNQALIGSVVLPPITDIDSAYLLLCKAWIIVFNGWAAVTLFFVLSGAVLFRGLQAGQGELGAQLGRFCVRRFLRIYPTLLACLIVCAVVFYSAGILHGSPWVDLWSNALLYKFPLNGATWTLNVEILGAVYLVGLFTAYRLGGERALIAAVIASVLVIKHLLPVPDWFEKFRMFALAFALGVLIPTAFFKSIIERIPSWGWIVALIVLLMSKHVRIPLSNELLQVSAAVLVGMLYYGAAPRLARVLETPGAQYLGAISFSLYLFNVVFLELAQHQLRQIPWAVAHPLETAPLVALAVLLPAIPVAHLAMVYLERPSIWLGQRLTRRQPAAARPLAYPAVAGSATHLRQVPAE